MAKDTKTFSNKHHAALLKLHINFCTHHDLVTNLCSKTPLAKETMVGLRQKQNLKTGPSPDLSPVEALKIVNTVVQITNADSAQLREKIVGHVAKRTILPRSVSLVKAKAKALVVLSTYHLSTKKST